MSRNYDNWERLVAAVIKREEDWQLCHQLSIRTSSICSEASSMSGFGGSSNYIQVSDDVMFENNVESGLDVWPIPKLGSLKGVRKMGGQMGKGKFGTSFLCEIWGDQVHFSDHDFLAVGTQLVMKKLVGKVKVTEEEFSIVFGNCRHQNVAVPRAYYFSGNGNYIFNDYHSQGSLYDLLHGDKDGRPDWESRLKIAIGAARGIAHIHRQCGGKLAHGNIKSSNIFLNSEQYGCVSDFGLAYIMIIRPGGKWPAARHHSSEYNLKNASQGRDKDGRPDWESRLKIAIGAARGIAHIHRQCGGKLAHGNIKSSNIFLNSEQYGCVSDFGLAYIMIIRPGGKWPAARRHSSEYNLKNASQGSDDVYSFGVVLLQLLSGKSPVEPQGGFWRNVDLVEWALSMRVEDWSSKLFDQSLWSPKVSLPLCDELDMFNSESGFERKVKAEMEEMMRVATRCLAASPQDRPKMFEVVLDLNNICNIPRSSWITTKLNCCLLRHY